MTSGGQRAPIFRRLGRKLLSKPAISLKKSWGGYRRTTHNIYIHIYIMPSIISTLFLSLSLSTDATQIQGHLAGSSPPLSQQLYVPSFLSRQDFGSFFPRRLASNSDMILSIVPKMNPLLVSVAPGWRVRRRDDSFRREEVATKYKNNVSKIKKNGLQLSFFSTSKNIFHHFQVVSSTKP